MDRFEEEQAAYAEGASAASTGESCPHRYGFRRSAWLAGYADQQHAHYDTVSVMRANVRGYDRLVGAV